MPAYTITCDICDKRVCTSDAWSHVCRACHEEVGETHPDEETEAFPIVDSRDEYLAHIAQGL